ncbi:hypothetical protein ABZ595_25040 [Streptomyces rubradiris]|uniref:hypothetical protein n=1 Tax=Streptomyces rubradiris TaxID=285531 RepID=UPI0033EF08FA
MTITREWIGAKVTDGHNVGVLMDIIPDWEDPALLPPRPKRPVAFVRTASGSEWMASPKDLHPL